MIQKVYFKDPSLEKYLDLSTKNESNQLIVEINETRHGKVAELSFYMEFSEKIISYRDHKYTWEKKELKGAVLNAHSPKIIVLQSGVHVLSSANLGAWQIIDTNTVKWVLKSAELTPLFHYGIDGSRTFRTEFSTESYKLSLLYSEGKVPEFSRSKKPFKPIICFTDHCDFDNNEKLSAQLAFFKKNNVTISKGFFLNYFSKRKDNSSFENDADLLTKFSSDGHELFYHSLSQSIKDIDDSIHEFKTFQPPMDLSLKTYVDHGYQPYNFTNYKSSGLCEEEWVSIIKSKGIENFWTYLDSGTANSGIINQLNPRHFSIDRILKTQGWNFKFLIRSSLFFSGKEQLLMSYRKIAVIAKELLYKKSIKNILPLLGHSLRCLYYLVTSILFRRKNVHKFAKFTPFVFKARVNDTIFNFFQTIEMTNFEKSLSKTNMDLLIDEKGAFIGHCYFSSPVKHQEGKLFNGDEISEKNIENFNYLKQKIDSKEIWNPTIAELIEFTNETSKIQFYFDEEAESIKINNENVPIRYINYE